jgi:formylglycine-generating enzyme required for sulfatase activity
MHGFGNFADASFREARFGDSKTPFDDGHACHAPVGTFAPNAFGLHDMLGNVYEMTSDSFNASTIVLRGGSWMARVEDSRCAYRGGGARVLQSQATGLRAARSLE